MTKTFDEEYSEIIEDMKRYLLRNGLRMISFTYTDGWSFKLSLPKKQHDKLRQKK